MFNLVYNSISLNYVLCNFLLHEDYDQKFFLILIQPEHSNEAIRYIFLKYDEFYGDVRLSDHQSDVMLTRLCRLPEKFQRQNI